MKTGFTNGSDANDVTDSENDEDDDEKLNKADEDEEDRSESPPKPKRKRGRPPKVEEKPPKERWQNDPYDFDTECNADLGSGDESTKKGWRVATEKKRRKGDQEEEEEVEMTTLEHFGLLLTKVINKQNRDVAKPTSSTKLFCLQSSHYCNFIYTHFITVISSSVISSTQ